MMATIEALVDERLDDDCEDTGEVRQATRQYYLGLVGEDIELTDTVYLNESLEQNEAMVLGFIAGYESCLASHRS